MCGSGPHWKEEQILKELHCFIAILQHTSNTMHFNYIKPFTFTSCVNGTVLKIRIQFLYIWYSFHTLININTIMANLFFFYHHIPPKTTTLKTRSLLFCSYSQLKAAHKKKNQVCPCIVKLWPSETQKTEIAISQLFLTFWTSRMKFAVVQKSLGEKIKQRNLLGNRLVVLQY